MNTMDRKQINSEIEEKENHIKRLDTQIEARISGINKLEEQINELKKKRFQLALEKAL